MDVAIIIPTIRANEGLLQQTLRAVATTTSDDTQIVVPEGASFGENCNAGARVIDADMLVFLNDDTVPQPGWLPPLIRALKESRIAGSRLTYPDGRIQHAGVWLDEPEGVLTAHNVLEDLPSRDVEAVTGACLAIRRDTFLDAGGFDECFDNGYEDIDLCLRVGGCWYARESHVVHYESQSGSARWRSVTRNVIRLQEKHGRRGASPT